MRQIVLDTETTGLEPSEGHRIIEIGCVEVIDRRLTGKTFHQYINPERVVDDGAIEVHGITNEFLADKPLFEAIYDEFIRFVDGAELVIHNAPFDVGFINHEFSLLENKFGQRIELLENHCTILDTLKMAREAHPGQKNTLDALCKRYSIDNSNRQLHGALLDSEILADVYLAMTGGQTKLTLDASDMEGGAETIKKISSERPGLYVQKANEAELEAHEQYLEMLAKKSGGSVIWRQLKDL
jgi:DNA polymerase-3 subunit epsilon